MPENRILFDPSQDKIVLEIQERRPLADSAVLLYLCIWSNLAHDKLYWRGVVRRIDTLQEPYLLTREFRPDGVVMSALMHCDRCWQQTRKPGDGLCAKCHAAVVSDMRRRESLPCGKQAFPPEWISTAILHTFFMYLDESPEHLKRLRKIEPKERENVASSKISRTVLVIAPIDRVAARVT